HPAAADLPRAAVGGSRPPVRDLCVPEVDAVAAAAAAGGVVTVAFQEVPLPLGLPESPASLGPAVERRREPARLLAPAQAALTVVACGLPVPQGSKRIGRRGDKPAVLDDKPGRMVGRRTRAAWLARPAMSRPVAGRTRLAGPLAAAVRFSLHRARAVERAWPWGEGEGDGGHSPPAGVAGRPAQVGGV